MLVVSLTGGIASGKSTASREFALNGIPIIDLDVLARQVVEPNDSSKTLQKLTAYFGRDILHPDGTLNRPALGRKTFGKENETDRKVLNKYTHSAIRKRMAWLLFKYWMKATEIVIVDTPLAVEAGLWRLCGEMVLVWAPFETQLSRMLKRDGPNGLTAEDAQHRLSSQLPLQEKIPYADVVLDNADNASPSMEEQIQTVVRRWQRQHTQGLGRLRTLVQLFVPPVGILMALWAIYSRTQRVSQQKKERQQEGRRS